MYSLVRRFIKTGIGFLGIGLGLGLYMVVRRELWGIWPSPYVVTAHTHAVLVGFLMFLILGVALWLFPRPAQSDRRYRPGAIAAAYWLLLAGTLLRIAGELTRTHSSVGVVRWMIVLASVGQVLGLGVYFFAMWSRIRPVGSHLREARGERF